MIKYLLCAFLPAIVAIQSCSPQNNNQETEQSTVTVQQDEITETPQLQETTADTSVTTGSETTPVVTSGADNVSDEKQSNTQTKKEIENIVVSFISIGEGIDFEVAESYKQFIDTWKSASGKSVTYETVNWGREGETDYCIDMTNISDNESKKFLSETQQRLKNNNLVKIDTNQKCREARIRK